MAPRRLRPALVSLFATMAILFVGLPALAAPTLAFGTGGVNPAKIGGVQRDQNHLPNGISYDDCVANVTLQFTITAAQGTFTTGMDTVQVWAGTGDCTATASRASATAGTCQPVSDPVGVTASFTLNVSAQDLVYASDSSHQSPPGSGGIISTVTHHNDPSICNSRTTSAATAMNVAVLDFLSGGGSDASVSLVYQAASGSGLDIVVDTVGPPLPTGIGAPGIGDTLMKLAWTPADNASDTAGFTIFIDPKPGQEDAAGPPLQDGAAASVNNCVIGTTTDDSGTSVDDSGLAMRITGPFDDAMVDADAGVIDDASTSDTGSAADTGSSAGACGTPNACKGHSNVILDNINGSAVKTLDNGYYVYSAHSDKTQSSATITGLTNFVTYTIGVAATDLVGNVGSVAVFPCAVPQPIDDFWTTYRDDGGGAGGSFCALDGVGMPVGTSVMGLSMLVAAIGLVRRRRNR